VIRTDNVATSYFQTQKKFTPKQARWQDFLNEFDYIMEYNPGRANLVADALSRKGKLADISLSQSNLQDRIKNGLQHDTLAQTIIQLVKEGKTQRFWKDGLILTKGKRIYIPYYDNLRRKVIREYHDSKWTSKYTPHTCPCRRLFLLASLK